MRRFAITLLGLTLILQCIASAQTSDSSLQRLEREITRISKVAGGTVGASAIHLETGRRVSLNGGERFPMASSYKVPIAVQLLTRVDLGEIKLDDMIAIKPSDLHPGSGTLSDLFNKPGLALSVRNLLELMLLISDNSATDVVLRLAGGPGAVTARMRALGIEGINVDRPTVRVIAEWIGMELPPDDKWSPDLFATAPATVKPDDRAAAARKFEADTRDTSTPNAMADLLVRVYRKDLLKPGSAELLVDIMRRCRTGETRLKGILPEGTEVAHKTGTIGRTTNDVGIITLPDGAGHVAIAVFVKSSEKDVPQRERAIAEIARAAHDYFLFNPGTGHEKAPKPQ
ncbi:MAG TPA: class A beta-lactamase [Blastocatellia bacterium]|jgi:beta-lactamase class A|nr:class A beta-lactamase [Blastocatellia bacterium]